MVEAVAVTLFGRARVRLDRNGWHLDSFWTGQRPVEVITGGSDVG